MDEAIRVLHVDDDPDFGELVKTYLEREDERLAVTTAASASEGRASLAASPFDCVVSDYEMPGENGIEFLQSIRAAHPELPFILFTGKGSEEVASDAISAGVTDYLQKELGTDQYTVLANRVTNAVELHASRRDLAERNRELLRYKNVIHSMREAACIYDSAGRFEVVNDYLAEWYGRTRESLVGEESTLIAHVRELDDGDPFEALLAAERDVVRGEYAAEFPGHGHAVVEYQLTPLRVDGSIDGVVGVAHDVTARKRLEDALARRTSAIEAAPVGVTITDAGPDDCPIVYANRRFTELTGYDEGEVLGRNCRFLQGPDTDPEPVAAMRTAIEAEEPVTVELRNYRKDGSTFRNRVAIAPVEDPSGTVTNYVGFQEAVTDSSGDGRESRRQSSGRR